MGKYDGILIMSDWDGTLSTGGTVTEENCRAIRDFQAEGGLFTMCSGRNYAHFEKFKELVQPNAPVCAYNGALIVDTDGTVISESFLGEDALGAAREIIRSGIFTNRFIIYTRENRDVLDCDMTDFLENPEKYSEMHHYKLVFVGSDEEETLRGKAFAERILPKGYFAARSWKVGLEILKCSASKGEALKFMKKRLGARLAVAAGDYENDAEMLRAADIGYAVENAVPSVKEAADRITVSASDSAIARIISELA